MFFKKKSIYKYNMLEKYKINLELAKNDGNTVVEKIGESLNYNFYKFREKDATLSYFYILRQDKKNPKKVVYFGNYEDINCIYNEHLFLTRKSGELNRFDHFICLNVETGEKTTYRWKSPFGYMEVINGYGRFYNQDSIEKIYVENNKMIMEVKRTKTPDKEAQEYEYNIDMNYKLTVEYINGEFVATYSYEQEV